MKDASLSFSFAPIAPQRAFEDIAAQIRALVASGRLKPGDRLPAERDLAAKFEVSRNTLREALRALELSGVIELRKGATGGAFVLPGNPLVVVNGMRDLFQRGAITPEDLTKARIWLTEVVVRVACEGMDENDLLALENNVDLALKAEKAGDFDERSRIHREFHNLLAACTHNPIIEITMQAVMEVTREFIERVGPSENPHTLPSRRRLLKHLRAHDADAAVAEMSRFLTRVQAQYMDLWNSRSWR